MDKEFIALLPAEDLQGSREASSALVRFADGRMAVEDVCPDSTAVRRIPTRFRRSSPIVDPETREVIGYEMKQVRLKAGA